MRGIRERLETGRRWWLAECLLRLFGLALLMASYLVVRLDWWLAHQVRPHDATPLEFIIAAVACAALSLGLAFTIEGPGLFRLQPGSACGTISGKDK